jgi:hypothetical protein
MAELEMSGSPGVAFLIAATMMADIIAKACSSPQTAELNAGARAPTLMKWVSVGLIEALVLLAIAALIDEKYRIWIVLGGLLEAAITWVEYAHAKRSGLDSSEPGTETYS